MIAFKAGDLVRCRKGPILLRRAGEPVPLIPLLDKGEWIQVGTVLLVTKVTPVPATCGHIEALSESGVLRFVQPAISHRQHADFDSYFEKVM